MFQGVDSPTEGPAAARRQWMAVLARAPLDLLEQTLGNQAGAAPQAPGTQWLRAPETGLMMVQGRAGGTGERFNLGEVSVTRCALRRAGQGDAPATVGVAYVLGRSHRHAQLAAMADALLQDPAEHAAIAAAVLAPARQHIDAERQRRRARTQTSKVEFFTVAREAGGMDSDEDEA